MNKTYMCIDLKSFYASVECVLRGLDPLKVNLVVADASRTEKTICLAVTPALKSFSIPGRARLFEVVSKVKEINNDRYKNNNFKPFIKESVNIDELNTHNNYKLSYIIAPPQMGKYIEYSTKIYDIYLRYFEASDMHVYSIDEVFIDVTNYLRLYKMTPEGLARKIIKDIFLETGITATAGVGTNLYLAKVSMDIVAKHMPPDEYGARVAVLDERAYREKLWDHKDITDFWRVGKGYERRLHKLGLYTMGDIARCSLGQETDYYNEDLLYKEFGINAELLIDHAWGFEPTTMKDIKNYKPKSKSVTTGQVLHCGYDYIKTRLIVKEMIDLLALDLVDKKVLTNQLVLSLGYDIENLNKNGAKINREIVLDGYGRAIPSGSHGSINLSKYTTSPSILMDAILKLYDYIVDKNLLVRRLYIVASNIIDEATYKNRQHVMQLDIFTDFDNLEENIEANLIKEEKENKVQNTILNLKKKYGKNAVIKGMNLEEGGTTIDRNKQIGGHKA